MRRASTAQRSPRERTKMSPPTRKLFFSEGYSGSATALAGLAGADLAAALRPLCAGANERQQRA